MIKKRFQRKCSELAEYEDKCFEEVKNFIKPMNDELYKKEYEIILRRWWLNFSEKNGELQNHRIDFNKGYRCSFGVQFQEKGADPDDEQGTGFQIMENPTAYGLSIFRLNSFKKYKLKFLYKNIAKCFNEVIQNGLEKTAKRYRKE